MLDVRRCMVHLVALALVGRALILGVSKKKTYTTSEFTFHVASEHDFLRVTPFPLFMRPFGCALCTVPLANRQRMSLFKL